MSRRTAEILNLREEKEHDFLNMKARFYLGEVALYVADLARQKDFYQRVLGLELFGRAGRTGSFGSGWTSAGEALSD